MRPSSFRNGIVPERGLHRPRIMERYRTETTRAPGRPRSREAHEAILRTAIALIREVGYDAMTMDAIAARAGLGIALLPCYLGDRDAGVRRISGVLPDLDSELWIVTHQDLKNTARIRAFLEVIGDAIVGSRRGFEGLA